MVYACEGLRGPWMPTDDIKEAFKIVTQQQNHEIDLCKKDRQNTLRRKGKWI